MICLLERCLGSRLSWVLPKLLSVLVMSDKYSTHTWIQTSVERFLKVTPQFPKKLLKEAVSKPHQNSYNQNLCSALGKDANLLMTTDMEEQSLRSTMSQSLHHSAFPSKQEVVKISFSFRNTKYILVIYSKVLF